MQHLSPEQLNLLQHATVTRLKFIVTLGVSMHTGFTIGKGTLSRQGICLNHWPDGVLANSRESLGHVRAELLQIRQ